jgi:hypothetical protein
VDECFLPLTGCLSSRGTCVTLTALLIAMPSHVPSASYVRFPNLLIAVTCVRVCSCSVRRRLLSCACIFNLGSDLLLQVETHTLPMRTRTCWFTFSESTRICSRPQLRSCLHSSQRHRWLALYAGFLSVHVACVFRLFLSLNPSAGYLPWCRLPLPYAIPHSLCLQPRTTRRNPTTRIRRTTLTT